MTHEAEAEDGPDEPATGVAGRVSSTLDGIDVASIASGLVAETVTREIQRQVRQEVAPIATEAVAAVLTPGRLAALREVASAAAEAELKPPEPEPDPAPEPAPSDGDPAPTLYYGAQPPSAPEPEDPPPHRHGGDLPQPRGRVGAHTITAADGLPDDLTEVLNAVTAVSEHTH